MPLYLPRVCLIFRGISIQHCNMKQRKESTGVIARRQMEGAEPYFITVGGTMALLWCLVETHYNGHNIIAL